MKMVPKRQRKCKYFWGKKSSSPNYIKLFRILWV